MGLMAKGEHSGAKEVKLPKPKISLSDLIFSLHVRTEEKTTAFVKRGDEMELGSNDRFHIQVDNLSHVGVSKSSMENVRIKCEVIYKDDSEDFVTIFDARRSSFDTNFGWFFSFFFGKKNFRWLIKDLVTPEGYYNRGLVADVKVSLTGELLDKIGLQIFLEGDRRYLSTDDALRYLQCFFLVEN